MSDLAALISTPAAAKAGGAQLSAASVQPASSSTGTRSTAPLSTASDAASPPVIGQDRADRPNFQLHLQQQIGAPPVLSTQGTPPATACQAALQSIYQVTVVMPGNTSAAAVPVPAASIPTATPVLIPAVVLAASGNGLPAPGKILPLLANRESSGETDADTDDDADTGVQTGPTIVSPTTLALAGVMAQIAAPVMATTPRARSAETANQPKANASPSDDRDMPTKPGTSPARDSAATPAPRTQIAQLAVPADATASTLAAAVVRIALDAPDQPAAPATDALASQSVRLRPVVVNASAPANAPAAAFTAIAAVGVAQPANAGAGNREANRSGFGDGGLTSGDSVQDYATGLQQPGPALTSGIPQPLATGQTGVAAAIATPATHSGSPDFAALVDRLVEARAAARSSASPQVVQASISHAEFGRVGLRFEQGDNGLSVSLSSADPEFGRTAQAALAAQPAIAATGTSEGTGMAGSGQQPGGQSGQNGTTSSAPTQSSFSHTGQDQSGMAQSGFSQSGQQSQGRNPQPEPGFAAARPARPSTTASPRSTGSTRQSGILA